MLDGVPPGQIGLALIGLALIGLALIAGAQAVPFPFPLAPLP